jgi:hypothetical protein
MNVIAENLIATNQDITGIKNFTSNPLSSAVQSTDSNALVKYGTIDVANSAPIKTALNAPGSAPIYACRAWVNFNGTGTVAIRASGNVSSITDNGTGDYTINFATAMPDADYSIGSFTNSINNTDAASLGFVSGRSTFLPTTSNARVYTKTAAIDADHTYVNLSFFR